MFVYDQITSWIEYWRLVEVGVGYIFYKIDNDFL